MYIVLDTETTGLKAEDRIVSICWALYDSSAKEMAIRHHLIYPDGFTIPDAVVAIHGITTEQARAQGIPLHTAMGNLRADIANFDPQLYIGHNVAFDRPMVLNEYQRLAEPENLSPIPTYCTMEKSTDLCRIPRTSGPGYRWPRLGYLHNHLFGAPHDQAHDAQADVLATAKCFFELRRLGY